MNTGRAGPYRAFWVRYYREAEMRAHVREGALGERVGEALATEPRLVALGPGVLALARLEGLSPGLNIAAYGYVYSLQRNTRRSPSSFALPS